MRENTAFEKGIELSFDKLRQGGPTLGFDLRQETVDVFLDQPIPGGFFGTPPLLVDWGSRRRALERLAHDLFCVSFTDCLWIYVERSAWAAGCNVVVFSMVSPALSSAAKH